MPGDGHRARLENERDGGPGTGQIMDLLLGSETAAEDRRDFMRTQLVFWMLAATAGRAENFSVFLFPGGAYRLPPRDDILSAYPVLGHGHGKLSPHKIRMAMSVSGKSRHSRWQEICARHGLETAQRSGFGRNATGHAGGDGASARGSTGGIPFPNCPFNPSGPQRARNNWPHNAQAEASLAGRSVQGRVRMFANSGPNSMLSWQAPNFSNLSPALGAHLHHHIKSQFRVQF